MALPKYTELHYRIWHYTYLAIYWLYNKLVGVDNIKLG